MTSLRSVVGTFLGNGFVLTPRFVALGLCVPCLLHLNLRVLRVGGVCGRGRGGESLLVYLCARL